MEDEERMRQKPPPSMVRRTGSFLGILVAEGGSLPLSLNKSSSATHTNTLRHPNVARLGAPSATGLIRGSSNPVVSGHTNGHNASTCSSVRIPPFRVSTPSSPILSFPQNKGWTVTSPSTFLPSLPSLIPKLCTKFPPALSPDM
ncbi:hypothetical protein IEQ34_017807 [Dendrobium chrysotoxum]|uniref:Uncharacterized protein n=1 Tax=Dendrobium chrysotoxum TaxID=161865 RepID=A0AAV7GDM6_DENCH|nr:hypothetical protein IEQ34_017807 [Dendrobium chrysotoxum]